MCKIDAWKNSDETMYDYIKPLFSNINLINNYYAESNDPKLGTKLSGVFLFCSSASLLDNYIIINNANINPKIKEWVVKS